MYLTCLYKCIFIQHYKPRAAHLQIKPGWQTVHPNQIYKPTLNNDKHKFKQADKPYSSNATRPVFNELTVSLFPVQFHDNIVMQRLKATRTLRELTSSVPASRPALRDASRQEKAGPGGGPELGHLAGAAAPPCTNGRSTTRIISPVTSSSCSTEKNACPFPGNSANSARLFPVAFSRAT